MSTKIQIKKSELKKLYDVACPAWKTKFDEMLKPFAFDDTVDFDSSILSTMQQACTREQLPIFNRVFKAFLPKESDLFTISKYSQVCKRLKVKELTIKDFAFLPTKQEQLKALATHQIGNIERLFNGDWTKDWSNRNQSKYYIWFEKSASGWVVSAVGDDCYCASYAVVGYYFDSKTARYCGETFIDIYSVFMNN